jgi:hypothetical protein
MGFDSPRINISNTNLGLTSITLLLATLPVALLCSNQSAFRHGHADGRGEGWAAFSCLMQVSGVLMLPLVMSGYVTVDQSTVTLPRLGRISRF